MNQQYSFNKEKKDYKTIHENLFYNPNQGYGLEKKKQSENSAKSFFLTHVTAGADYLISLRLHNLITDDRCLYVNDIEISKEWIQVEDGYFQEFKFAAIEDYLNVEIPVDFNELSELSITVLTKRKSSDYPVLFLIGDSTVKTYDVDQAPMAGDK